MDIATRPASSGRYARRALIPRDQAPDDVPGDVVDVPATPAVIVVGTPGGDGSNDPGVAPGFLTAAPFPGWPDGWAMPWMEPTPELSTFFGYGAQDPAGYLNRVSTVGTCVDINSRAVVAMAAYAVTKGIPGDLPDWYQTTPEPLEYADWCEFVGLVVDDLMYRGEAILWAVDHYHTGYPSRFVALDPARVLLDERGRYSVVVGDAGAGDVLELDRADVCHIKYKHDRAASRGYGPLAWAGRDVVSADLLDRYADNLAKYGASAVLQVPGDMNSKQTAELRRDWGTNRAANPGVPAILYGGITYASQSMSPRDMALLDLKIFDLQMVANAFGVPSSHAGLPTAAGGLTYSSPEMVRRQHWTGFLLPLCQRIAGALSNWLLPRGTRFEFNPNRYLQGDALEQSQALADGFNLVDEKGRRGLTIDEYRAAMRYAPWDVAQAGLPSTPDALVGSARG